eukprot:1319614-Amorphochlora_amoeboformis.AAC.1
MSPGDNKLGDSRLSGGGDQKKFDLLDEMSIKYTLNQEEVIQNLIPEVRKKWGAFKAMVRNASISIPHLESTFATLPTDEHYASELVLLARTGDGKVETKTGSWVSEAMLKLKDFSMLMAMKNSIPAILRLRSTALASLFKDGDTENDTLFTQLSSLEKKLQSEWEKHTLKSLSMLIGPVKRELGTQLTPVQLRFLTLLGAEVNDPMTAWLIKQKHQGQFNQWRQFATDSC